MLSERDIQLAHADAFDFVWGNLPAAKRGHFNRHLGGCSYCQAIVDEYSEIGRIIKDLPPHVEPPADLEKRTVTAMVAALAEQTAKADRRSDAEDQAATRVYPVPQREPLAEDTTRLYPPPAASRRPSRKPERWSLGCLCGDVIEAASLLSRPSLLPSSLLPLSSHSALAAVSQPGPSPSSSFHPRDRGRRLRARRWPDPMLLGAGISP